MAADLELPLRQLIISGVDGAVEPPELFPLPLPPGETGQCHRAEIVNDFSRPASSRQGRSALRIDAGADDWVRL